MSAPFGDWSPPPPPARRRSRGARSLGWLGSHPTRRAGVNWGIWAVIAVAIIGAAAPQKPTAKAAAASGTTSASASASTASAELSESPTAAPAAARTSTVADAAPHATPRPSTNPVRHVAVGDQLLPGGVVLPNRARTPGARNPSVTQATIHTTICVSGWTSTIRPNSSYTTALKRRQLATGYAYRGDSRTSSYEEDHLISLELGGSPSSERNLWPEPYAAAEGARIKDHIENKLHALVCSGQLGLRTAQAAIAINWWSAYQRYGTRTVIAPPKPRPHTTTVVAPPQPTSAPPASCYPLSNGGNCYEAGEFCRASDEGVVGRAGNGEAIKCVAEGDRHRWVPA